MKNYISYLNSMNDFNDMLICINNIKKDNIKILYNFDNINREIDNIVYNDIINNFVINSFITWKENNLFHSFPKTKKAWINTINNQKKLKNVYKKYELRSVIYNINNNIKIPYYEKTMYDNVIHGIRNIINLNFNELQDLCYIIIDLSASHIINILLEFKILYISGKKIKFSNIYSSLNDSTSNLCHKKSRYN